MSSGIGQTTTQNSQPGAALQIPSTKEIQDKIDLAYNWLLNSGVQHHGTKEIENGGFVSWYEADKNQYPFIYCEITGYMCTHLSWWGQKTGDSKYIESAKQAADWLIRVRNPQMGAYPANYPLIPERVNFKKDLYFAFDNGMILNGLASLYRRTKIEKYLAAAVSVADWLILKTQKSSGGLYPVWNVADNTWVESDQEWSLCTGSYLAKCAIGLLNLFDVCKDERYLKSAEKLCDFALTCQAADGRFLSFLNRGGTNAHPHNYTCEALWVAGTYLGRKEYLDASARGTAWILSQQDERGYIPRLFIDSKPIYNERVDALGQTLRMALLHEKDGRLSPSNAPKMEKLLRLISSYQATSSNPKVNGGFYFGSGSGGEKISHVNVWVTSFVVQALSLYLDRNNAGQKLYPFDMV